MSPIGLIIKGDSAGSSIRWGLDYYIDISRLKKNLFTVTFYFFFFLELIEKKDPIPRCPFGTGFKETFAFFFGLPLVFDF